MKAVQPDSKNNRKNTHAIPNNRRDRRRVRVEALRRLHVRRVQVLRAVREEVEACGVC
jgi:hypothetical protein